MLKGARIVDSEKAVIRHAPKWGPDAAAQLLADPSAKYDIQKRLLNKLGKPYALIHQADRFPSLWDPYCAKHNPPPGDRQGVARDLQTPSLHVRTTSFPVPLEYKYDIKKIEAAATGATAGGLRRFPPDFGHSQAGNAVPEYLFNQMMRRANALGTFVEFGCADGTTHSTTYAFEKMGWRGLCIEPNYPQFRKVKAARKNAIFALVTGKPGKFTYAQMSGPECDQASGIIEFYSAAYRNILAHCEEMGMVERVPLEGVPLDTLLTAHGFSQVDWISVDCEGCEGSFITNFDFTKWGVQMVNYEPNTAARMHTAEIEAAFKKHGFVFDRELQDRIWRKPGPFALEGNTLSMWGSVGPARANI